MTTPTRPSNRCLRRAEEYRHTHSDNWRKMSSSKPKLGKRKAPAAKGHVPVKKGPRKPRGMVKLPPGTVLTDLTKKKWRLGELVGWGGFGAIYLGKIYLTCELLVGDLKRI